MAQSPGQLHAHTIIDGSRRLAVLSMERALPPPRPVNLRVASLRQPTAKPGNCGGSVASTNARRAAHERRGQLRGHLRASRPGRVRGMPAPALGDCFTSGSSQVHRSRQLQPIHSRARNLVRPRRRRRRRRPLPRPPMIPSAPTKAQSQANKQVCGHARRHAHRLLDRKRSRRCHCRGTGYATGGAAPRSPS